VTQTEKKQVLFIHGGGNEGYEIMPNGDTPDFGWLREIGEEISI
jgi:hypothetical protein